MNYKPFLPSSLLSIHGPNENGAWRHDFNNFALRGGVILNTYDIDDESNSSQTFVEYDVAVIEQDDNRGSTSVIYKNCLTLDSLGSIPDFFEFKRRQPKKKEFIKDLKSDDQNGSFVLLLCMNGVSEKGIIIGGLSHPKRATKLTKDAGTHMEGEYNGLNIQVNKDGEFTITFKSASDNDGKYANAEAGGTYIKIDKNGSIDINDGKTEFIKIDKSANTISVEAAKDISIKTQENINIEATKNVSAKMKDLLIEASGKAEIKIMKGLNITVDGAAQFKSKQFEAQIDSICKFQANTFQVTSSSIILGNGAAPAVTLNTKFIGNSPFMGLPVIVQAMGPFSPSVMIAS